MPTARFSLTVTSGDMPVLKPSKRKTSDTIAVPPWEKQPGYWESPYGRLAIERRQAVRIADMHPEAVYHASRLHADEQYAAATRQHGLRTQVTNHFSPKTSPSPLGLHRGARRFAEANPEIVNRYVRWERSLGDNVLGDAENICNKCWTDNQPITPLRLNHQPARQSSIYTGLPHNIAPQETCPSSGYGHRPFCDACQDCAHTAYRDNSLHRNPDHIGAACLHGRDDRIHDEACFLTQAEPYCRCQDCYDGRGDFLSTPCRSYVRVRARNGEKEA